MVGQSIKPKRIIFKPQGPKEFVLLETHSDFSLLESLSHHLEKEMATHPSILAWKIPWTEEPGGVQAMGSQSRT